MRELGDKLVVCFDVDDTLIMWNNKLKGPGVGDNNVVRIKCDGMEFIAKFHQKHITNLINHKNRGHHIIVWSAGGGEWAAKAVKALGIEKYVDECMNKPSWYYDDKKVEDWMGSPIFLEE